MTILEANSLVNIDKLGIKYRYLLDEEIKKTIEYVKKEIDKHKPRPTKEQWNSAWNEIFESLNGCPSYLCNYKLKLEDGFIFRLNGKYIKTNDLLTEKKFHKTLVSNIARTHFKNCDRVVEFGCGTGHNLLNIKDCLPNVDVYGSDWTESSIKILKKKNIKSFKFDMLLSKDEVPNELFKKGTGLLTFGSMEQLGVKWKKFFNYILDLCPDICVHVEPIIELYDTNQTIDKLAYDYHKSRGYLEGYFKHLLSLNTIINYSQTRFGNVLNDGYTVITFYPNRSDI